MPTRILGARRGVTKPKPWRITPRRVAPEGQWAWEGLRLALVFWEGGGSTVFNVGSDGGSFGFNSAPVWQAGRYGRELFFDGTDDYVDIPAADAPDGMNQLSIFALIRFDDWGSTGSDNEWNAALDTLNGTAHPYTMEAASDSSTVLQWKVGADSNVSVDFQGDLDQEVGNWHTYGGTYDGSEVRTYFDGAFEASAALTGSIVDTSNGIHIGGGRPGADVQMQGAVGVFLLAETAWTDAQHATLADRPFAPFRPQRVAWVGGPTADGVQTITAAWSESVGPDDTQDPQATLRPELSEAVGATDVFGAAATLVGAWSETAGPRETYEVAKTVTATLDETVGPTDTQGDVVATLAASISEGLDAGETWAATLMATAVYSETVGPTDTFELPETVVSAAWEEGTDASDTFLATLAAVANLQEIVGASETIEVDATLVASYLETVGPTDLWDATGTFGAAVTETAGPTDSFQLPADAAAKLTALIQTAARVAGQLQSRPRVDADDGTRPGVDGTPGTNS